MSSASDPTRSPLAAAPVLMPDPAPGPEPAPAPDTCATTACPDTPGEPPDPSDPIGGSDPAAPVFPVPGPVPASASPTAPEAGEEYPDTRARRPDPVPDASGASDPEEEAEEAEGDDADVCALTGVASSPPDAADSLGFTEVTDDPPSAGAGPADEVMETPGSDRGGAGEPSGGPGVDAGIGPGPGPGAGVVADEPAGAGDEAAPASSASPFMLVCGQRCLTWAFGSDSGRVRPANEDRVRVEVLPDQTGLLAVLADGMGGNRGGGIAAEVVTATVVGLATAAGEMPPAQDQPQARYEWLFEIMASAGAAVEQRAAAEPRMMTMGSTGVAALVTGETCLYLYAGDSRLYHYRQGARLHVSKDQSVVQVLLDLGDITPEQALTHPMRATLTSCFGGGPRARLTLAPQWREGAAESEQRAWRVLEPGDVILLCSDGLSGEVPPAALDQLVAIHGTDPQALVNAAIAAANDGGGVDNITVAAIIVTDAVSGRP